MIFDVVLNAIGGLVNLLLMPLEIINITVDFISGIAPVMTFFKIVAYVLPWSNIMPLIGIIISIYILRIVISLIKTIWDLLPIV